MRKALHAGFFVAASLVAVAAMAAEPLGRLFFTPAQRSVLDAGKYSGTPSPAKPGPRSVQLNGVVTRSDAERTVWINGTPYYNASPDGVQVKTNPSTPATTSIRVPGKNTTARVKVGQRLDLNSGQVREGFSRRTAVPEGSAAPVESPALPPAAPKKSEGTEDAAPPIREVQKSAGKDRGAGTDGPAAAR